LEENERRRQSLDQDRIGNVGDRIKDGLEIETGFKIWIDWISQ
jgi:hypothetical protein